MPFLTGLYSNEGYGEMNRQLKYNKCVTVVCSEETWHLVGAMGTLDCSLLVQLGDGYRLANMRCIRC